MDCTSCGKVSSSIYYDADHREWVCRYCRKDSGVGIPYFKETGNNSYNPKATKAHLDDVGDRRYHPTEKRMFYYSKEGLGKTYFFPNKGKL